MGQIAMPYSFDVNRPERRVTVVGSDPVGLPDVLALLDRQIAEGAWSYGTLHDARLVTWEATPDDIRVIVAYVDNNARTLGPRGPVAFVATGGVLVGMARMYDQIAHGSALLAEVFSDVGAAALWLDQQAQQ
jgi:hypothetical protein